MIRRTLLVLLAIGLLLPLFVFAQGQGPITSRSGTLFVDAVTNCISDTTTLVAVRAASGDWSLQRTATGAETFNIHCTIALPWRTGSSRGVRIDSFRIAHQITVVALTSATFQGLNTTTYVNNTATAVATYGGAATITLPTATQAQPYLTAGTLATPAFMTTANAAVSIDFQVVMANTGVWSLKGIGVTYSTDRY